MNRVVIALIKQKNHMGQDEYLLIQSLRNFGEFTGYWYFPGRHVKENETDEEALIEEVKRQLNLKIKPLKVIEEVKQENSEKVLAIWDCEIVGNKEFKINEEELNDAEYFTRNDMTVIYLWPTTKEFLEKYIFKGPII